MLRSSSSLNSVLLKQIQADSSKPRTEIAGFNLIDFKKSVSMENIETPSAGSDILKIPSRKNRFFIFLILSILSLFGPTPTMLSEKWKPLEKWSKFNASLSSKMHGSISSPSWIGMMIANSSQICQLELKTRGSLVIARRILIFFRFIVQLKRSNSFCVLPMRLT